MSHFTVLAIMPLGKDVTEDQVNILMEKFSENIEVPPYKRDDGEESTYNPLSKWDWYAYGGRWDGAFVGIEHESDNGFNFSDECRQIENNSGKVSTRKKDFVPFAFVTPDGEWIERGSMGWWAIVSDEKDKDKWDSEAKSVFEKYADHNAVLIDCHI